MGDSRYWETLRIPCIPVRNTSQRHSRLTTYLVGSNGASQAILDAEALTNALLGCSKKTSSSHLDIPAALRAYENERLPPTAKIVMANRANGPDHVMQVAEERAPQGFKNIHDVIPKEELEEIGRAYKVVAGFDIEKVNQKADSTSHVSDSLGLKSPAKWVSKEKRDWSVSGGVSVL